MLDGSLPWQTLSFISCLFMQWSVLTVQPNLRSVKGNQGYLKSNLLSNSLQYLNCKINIDWPNLSFQIYKIKCKGLFLWIKRCLKNSKISMMIKWQNIMLDINWENFYNMWNNLIRLIFFYCICILWNYKPLSMPLKAHSHMEQKQILLKEKVPMETTWMHGHTLQLIDK